MHIEITIHCPELAKLADALQAKPPPVPYARTQTEAPAATLTPAPTAAPSASAAPTATPPPVWAVFWVTEKPRAISAVPPPTYTPPP